MKKVVKVNWRDSHRYTYQMSADEPLEYATIETIGWFVREDKKQIVLAQDIIGDDIRGVIVIPKENIIKKN